MTKEQEGAQRWILKYKCSNTNAPGWNWKLLKLMRRNTVGKNWHVFTWGSKQQALEAADELYGRENCKVEPLKDNCAYPEFRVDKKEE